MSDEPRARSRATAGPRCAYCQEPLASRQDLVVAADDHVFHVPCYALARRPSAKLDQRGAPAVCAACGEPLQSIEDGVALGRILVHVDCYERPRRVVPPTAA
ncbi:MAG TPA: hypothetical protein VNN07_07575 [Candidatus Tectomicrobia bacterium]|nr:hypothetical protein [Candidatus Tectomicrobia bacterium]